MKMKDLVGERFKERPAGCAAESHALMVRGGYIKPVANGIFSALPPLRRVTRKIEQILREEMDAIGGQEVQLPVVMPASLWEASGRYGSIGKELVRFSDRTGSPMVLGMTHEEAAVQLVRDYAGSYTKYPFMIYQIQTKFRDEARPRAGLIRVREFTMKDAYSFHTDHADLEAYYARCLAAYRRIFARVGLPEVIDVASDAGMMGGRISHEFMLLTPIGEDSIAVCPHCGYRANLEAAENIILPPKDGSRPVQALESVSTPGVCSIEALCGFFGLPASRICKAVVYQKDSDGSTVVLFLRGDLEVNEIKLANLLGEGVHPAVLTEDSALCAGYIGPVGLPDGIMVLFDRSLEGESGLICGANRTETHYTGLDIGRDVRPEAFHDLALAREGGICPGCGRPSITITRGIEVGNIFQLGDKYTRSMGMIYTDAGGRQAYPVMGCYGIGVGRLAAAVCEVHHDDYGPVWPAAIAPWQVHLCALRADQPEVAEWAEQLYAALEACGLEVILDDRAVSAGVMFSDADLLGVPLRIILSPRGIREGLAEICSRDRRITEKVDLEAVCTTVRQLLSQLGS